MKAIFCFKLTDGDGECGYIKTSIVNNEVIEDIEDENYEEVHKNLIDTIKEQLNDNVKVECISCNEYLAMTDED
jgi:hemoglobin-like flavoprotein